VFSRVSSIAATGSDQVTITLKQPDYWLEGELASMPGIIIEKSFAQQQGKNYGTPAGSIMCTGAYELKSFAPGAGVVATANPPAGADFILCSHVFYYIPRRDWEANARRLVSWLAPGGVLAVAVQNPNTDCMQMVDYFISGRCDLGKLAEVLRADAGGRLDLRLDTVPARIRTSDLRTTCEVAEFILNVLPLPNPPAWYELEMYVANRFARPGGGYEMSCDQDFLRIVRC
jgi:hypothetical protein